MCENSIETETFFKNNLKVLMKNSVEISIKIIIKN